MKTTRIAGGLAAGMVVIVVVAALPGAEVPALPPPVTLRSDVVVPENGRSSLVITPEPVFEDVGDAQPEAPLEIASPDEDPADTQAVSGDSPDDAEIQEPTEDASVDSPDDLGENSDPIESADSPDADSVDSPDSADSPDD